MTEAPAFAEVDVLLAQAELASAGRNHHRAAALLRTALVVLADDADSRVPVLLRLADAEQRAGRVDAAWAACRAVAAFGRIRTDGRILAQAALATPDSGHGAWSAMAERHALAAEAIRALGDAADPYRHRLEVLLAATEDPWSGAPRAVVPARSPSTPDERFEQLRASHDASLQVRFAGARLELADEAAALGGPRGDEYLAWASLWRVGAYTQLGRRLERDGAVLQLDASVRRLREPIWDWRAATVDSATALLEGDLERAAACAAHAVEVAGAGAPPEVGFVDLVLRSDIASRGRRGLDRIEEELRPVLARMPFFAQGWRAQVLLAAGRLTEVQEIWDGLAAHVSRMPEASIEWLVAVAGFARVAVALGDRDAATELRYLLAEVDGFHVVGDGQTPPGGPVSLLLGQLAELLDDHDAARSHFRDAVREADALGDAYHARLARSALRGRGGPAHSLSVRELEIARLIAEGGSNRTIGQTLHLSVRTVESHVSHILTKLDLDSRTAIVRWYLSGRHA